MRAKTFFVVLFTALLFGSLAFSQSVLGSMFRLGNVTQATLPASSATTTGALAYVSDDAGFVYNTGASWQPVERLSLAGSAGYGVAINNTTVLGLAKPAARATSTNISCVFGGAGAGSDLYVALANGTIEYCYCTLGNCTGGTASCSCPYTVPANTEVYLLYLKTGLDGGARSNCATNPTEITCNVN